MAIQYALLLAMQAAGMVVDYMGNNEQVRLGKMGAEIEQAGINSNIASSRLQYEDESLQAMKQLRQNMGTQAAMLAARGTRPGAGTAALFGNESVGNFNADERMRKINFLSNQANLKAGVTLSKLHEKTFENTQWNTFKNNLINKIPTNPEAYTKFGESFGLTKFGGS
jgi:hypothetical protein